MLALMCGPLGCVSHAQAPALAKGFDAYRTVRLRNIFDPDRLPMPVTEVPPPVRTVDQPRKAGDYVVLTGIMLSDGKALAFFSGSRPDYDKVIAVDADIAGAKLTRILPAGIEVDRGGKKVSISVGQTVPFDNSPPGPPPIPAGEVTSPSAAAGGVPLESNNSQTPSPLPGNLTEVMRHMMERRQNELK
jgi:hypothetical protein